MKIHFILLVLVALAGCASQVSKDPEKSPVVIGNMKKGLTPAMSEPKAVSVAIDARMPASKSTPREISERLAPTRALRYHTVQVTPENSQYGGCMGVIVAANAFLTNRGCFFDHSTNSRSDNPNAKKVFSYFAADSDPQKDPTPRQRGVVKRVIDFAPTYKSNYNEVSRACDELYKVKDPGDTEEMGKATLEFVPCMLSRYQNHNIVLMITKDKIFSKKQILPISTQISAGEALTAITIAWLRESVLKEGTVFDPDNMRSHSVASVVRDLEIHSAPYHDESISFLRCSPRDPFDMCVLNAWNQGGPLVRKTREGYEVVGVLSGLAIDPVKVTNPLEAYELQKISQEVTVDPTRTKPYSFVLAPAPVTQEIKSYIEKLK